jgi:hypothetical protein
MLDRRESVLFFSVVPSDVSDAVSLLSFFRFFQLRRSLDGGNSVADCEPSRRRLSGFSSSDSRFRFPRVDCGGPVGLPVAVQAGWTGLGGRDSTVGILGEGVSCAWTFLVEGRVVLLDGVGLRIDVSSERAARIGEVLLEAAAFLFFLTPADCFSLGYQHWRLREEC